MDRRSLGAAGEEAAARYLEGAGYRILDRNIRRGRCELDIIAEGEGVMAFVEVKTRSSSRYGAPAEAVTPAKQRNIVRAALLYLQERDMEPTEIRFDVIEVLREGGADRIRHIPGAFDGADGSLFY